MPSTVPTDAAHQTGPKVPTGIVPNVLTDLSSQNQQGLNVREYPGTAGHRRGWWSLGDSNP